MALLAARVARVSSVQGSAPEVITTGVFEIYNEQRKIIMGVADGFSPLLSTVLRYVLIMMYVTPPATGHYNTQ